MDQENGSTIFSKVLILIVIVGLAGFVVYAKETGDHTNVLATASVPMEQGARDVISPDASLSEIATPSVTHIATPKSIQGIYISGWSAGTASSMSHIYNLLSGGKLNAVVIDIKDATGKLSYEPLDQQLLASGVGTKRIRNLPDLLQTLHSKGIYVIGRVAVFQDPYYASIHPEDALQDTDGTVWRDDKGLAWLRADSTDVWHYTEAIAEDAYAQGFDEINVDYVRFPSDGKLNAIDETTFMENKSDTVTEFFADLDARLRQQDHIPLSADIFGLTVSAEDDLGIGQLLVPIASHVDYICPMIYPSHFAPGSYGFKDPNLHPYDVIHTALTHAEAKLTAAGIPQGKLRPWLQDFNLGAVYTPEMVQAQITATNDANLDSYVFWDAKNLYTASVFE